MHCRLKSISPLGPAPASVVNLGPLRTLDGCVDYVVFLVVVVRFGLGRRRFQVDPAPVLSVGVKAGRTGSLGGGLLHEAHFERHAFTDGRRLAAYRPKANNEERRRRLPE
jgi:hypothetical protein